MEDTKMREILLALAQTGINLSPGAFRVLMATPQPKETLSQLVINYFTSKFARKTLSEEDVGEILKSSPLQIAHSTQPVSIKSGSLPRQGKGFAIPVTNGDALESKSQAPKSQVAPAPPPTPSNSPKTLKLPIKPAPSQVSLAPLLNNSDLQSIPGAVDNFEPKLEQLTTEMKQDLLSDRSLGGVGSWKPLAREYSPDIKVISDPTKDLFTNGEIDDFMKVFLNRYEKLRKILLQRRDANDAIPISEVRNLKSDQEVKVIGMVVDKRQTKTHNTLIELEDPTGRITSLVSQNKPEMFALLANLMQDQVICVSGLLRIGEGRSRMIMVNEFFWPDVPLNFRPNHTDDRVCAMCVSDLHVGSKEFIRPLWDRMVEFLHGRIGNERQRQLAGEVKYVLIAGDAIDGIGVYPSQESDLIIDSIQKQYGVLEQMLQSLPDYIQVIYIPGNHEPVRNALPMPAIPKKYVGDLQSHLNVMCLGNPAMVAVHGVKALLFHGDSFLDFSMNVPTVSVDHPETAMVECLRGRHLAPSFGKKTELAPAPIDWLVVDEIPDFLHTGHIHINGLGKYRNVLCVGSGCFEAQTDYMKSLGIVPTPGKPIIVRLYSPELQPTQLELQGI